MNQKAFAIFIGAVMVLSAFTGIALFFLPDKSQVQAATSVSATPEDFGIEGNLVRGWSFGGVKDVLMMSPENTTVAYWADLEKSPNLTALARTAMPPSYGLDVGKQIYGQDLQRFGAAYFNNTMAEFHQVTPFRIGYDSLVITYKGYMIVPLSMGGDVSLIFGIPVILGPTDALKQVIDVLQGNALDATVDQFDLASGEVADMQFVTRDGESYDQSYIGVTQESENSYAVVAKFENVDEGYKEKINGTSVDYGLTETTDGEIVTLSGVVNEKDVIGTLAVLLGP